MREYQGKEAGKYGQTSGKRLILFPTLENYFKKVPKGSTLLDVGCGDGGLYPIAKKLGLVYTGFDQSTDMIAQASKLFPQGKFKVARANNFTHLFKSKFKVIVLSALFPSVKTVQDMTKVLQQCKRVLAYKGFIVIGDPHPAFDGYMQSYLFNRKEVATKFKGYFASGVKVSITHDLNNKKYTFNDYHKPLSDYFKAIVGAGLRVLYLDECPPGTQAKKAGKDFYNKRSSYPSYLVLIAGR